MEVLSNEKNKSIPSNFDIYISSLKKQNREDSCNA